MDTLHIKISAELRCTNGTVVAIGDRTIVLRKPGERGGAGVNIPIPMAEWDTIDQKVRAVRHAIAEAQELTERVTAQMNEPEDNNAPFE